MNFVERIRKRDEEKIQKLINMYYIPKRFSDSKLALGPGNDNIIKNWSKKYNEMQYQVPKETGEYIEKLFDDDNYMLGIHRTAFNYEETFRNGIRMRSNDFTSNVQISGYLPFLLEQIKYCEGYKSSTGCMIVQIPKNNSKPIYFVNDGEYYLLPEYIAGFVPVSNQVCGDMIKNPNFRENHDYKFDGLEYDEILENPQIINMRKSH